MASIKSVFGSSHDNVPLHERDIIEIAPAKWDDDMPELFDPRVINFQHILATGAIPIRSPDDLGNPYALGPDQKNDSPGMANQHIDWESEDAFTRALDQVKQATFDRIAQDPQLQELLQKPEWGREDRVEWEREVSAIVSQEMHKIPGLDKYRLAGESEGDLTADYRATRLNDLATDIENGTATIEHDCETMSIFEGIILQQADNHLLPETAPEDDYKVGSNYFYTSGYIKWNVEDGIGGHAFIVSSATGNMIEGTDRPPSSNSSQYQENVDPDYSFEDFVRNGIAFNKDETIYGSDSDLILVSNISTQLAGYIHSESASSGDTGQDTIEYPPEVEALLDLKRAIMDLEHKLEDTNLPARYSMTYESRLEVMKSRFDTQLEETVQTGGIYEVIEFFKNTPPAENSDRTNDDRERSDTQPATYSQTVGTGQDSPPADGNAAADTAPVTRDTPQSPTQGLGM